VGSSRHQSIDDKDGSVRKPDDGPTVGHGVSQPFVSIVLGGDETRFEIACEQSSTCVPRP